MKASRTVPVHTVWLVPAVLFLGFHFSASALGTIFIYSSFGPGNTYNSSADWLVGGSASAHGYQGHAEFFVPGISGYLSQIRLATRVLGGVPLSNFFIAQDNGDGIPGAILESFSHVADANGVLTINSVTTPPLQAGQKYWLCDEPVDPSTYTGWCLNSQGVTNSFAPENAEWSWYAFGPGSVANSVFSISVVPVPEPSIAGVTILGVGLLAARSWRRVTAGSRT